MEINHKRLTALTFVLVLVISTVPLGVIGSATAEPTGSPSGDSFTIQQESACYVVEAYSGLPAHVSTMGHNEEGGSYQEPSWNGPVTVESVMDYRFRFEPDGDINGYPFPIGQYKQDAPYLNDYYVQEPWKYSTYGLYNWSENGESHMFFYEDANGISLVMRHDRLYDTLPIHSHDPYNPNRGGFTQPSPGGGAATFEFENLPQGEWAYLDDVLPKRWTSDQFRSGTSNYYHWNYDAYLDDQPSQAEYNSYTDFHGGSFTADWSWSDGQNDGGAYRGFENLDGSVTINPSFNQDAAMWNRGAYDSTHESITSWEIRDARTGEWHTLSMNESLTITPGANCEGQPVPAPSINGFAITSADDGTREVTVQFNSDAQLSAVDVSITDSESYTETLTLGNFMESGGTYIASTTLPADGTYTATLNTASNDGGDGASGQQDSVTIRTETATPEPTSTPEPDNGTEVPDNGTTTPDDGNETTTPEDTTTPDNQTTTPSDGTETTTPDNGTTTPDDTETTTPGDNNETTPDNGTTTPNEPTTTPEDGTETTTPDDGAETTIPDDGTETTTPDSDTETTTPDDGSQTTTPDGTETTTPDNAPTAKLTWDWHQKQFNQVVLDTSGSTDDNGIVTYVWDFDGNGVTDREGADVDRLWPKYHASGTYTATVTVYDESGQSDSASVTIEVDDTSAPTLNDFEVPDDVAAGQEFKATLGASYDPAGVTVDWKVDGKAIPEDKQDQFAKRWNGNEQGAWAKHTFDEPGTHTVTVIVTDGEGNSDSKARTVTVHEEDWTPPKNDASRSDDGHAGDDSTDVNDGAHGGHHAASNDDGESWVDVHRKAYERQQQAREEQRQQKEQTETTPTPTPEPTFDPAMVEVVNVELDGTTVQMGETVTINVTVFNGNDLNGTVDLTLMGDDAKLGTKTVTLDAGETKTVSFQAFFDEAGSVDLGVGGLSRTLAVTEPTTKQMTDDEKALQDETPTMQKETTNESGQPGFGIVAALVALAGAILMTGRRLRR